MKFLFFVFVFAFHQMSKVFQFDENLTPIDPELTTILGLKVFLVYLNTFFGLRFWPAVLGDLKFSMMKKYQILHCRLMGSIQGITG